MPFFKPRNTFYLMPRTFYNLFTNARFRVFYYCVIKAAGL